MEFKGTKGMRVEMHPRLIDVYTVSRPGFHYDPKRLERKANEKLFQHSFELLEMLHKLTEHFKTVSPLYSKDKKLIQESEQLIKEATTL